MTGLRDFSGALAAGVSGALLANAVPANRIAAVGGSMTTACYPAHCVGGLDLDDERVEQ